MSTPKTNHAPPIPHFDTDLHSIQADTERVLDKEFSYMMEQWLVIQQHASRKQRPEDRQRIFG